MTSNAAKQIVRQPGNFSIADVMAACQTIIAAFSSAPAGSDDAAIRNQAFVVMWANSHSAR